KRGDVSCKADAEQIEGVELTLGVSEAQKINRTSTARQRGVERSLRTGSRKVAKKRIASAEWKKAESDASDVVTVGKYAVEDFVCGAIAAHGQKMAIALIVGFASELYGVTGPGGSDDVNVQAAFAQACERRPSQLG